MEIQVRTMRYETENELQPRPVVPTDVHIHNCPVKKIPKRIVVRLTGLSESGSVSFKKSHGLNNEYKGSTWNEIEVTDENDICFFIKKAIKSSHIYEILEPYDLIDDHITKLRSVEEEKRKKHQEEKQRFLSKLKPKKRSRSKKGGK